MIRPLNRIVFTLIAAGFATHAGALSLPPPPPQFINGDFYASEYHTTTLQHYDSYGRFVGTLTLPTQYGIEVRGMASRFDDGLLYAVMPTSAGFNVVAVDVNGSVRATYQGASQIPDAGYDGKIAFSPDGKTFYVAAQNITAFTVGTPQGRVLYSVATAAGVQVDFSDVATLPSGNLLVMGLGANNNVYHGQSMLYEITSDGRVNRQLPMNMYYVHAMAYDGKTNRYYIAGDAFQGSAYDLWAFNYSTLASVMGGTAPHTTDIAFTDDGYTIVGSFSDGLRVYDANLNRVYPGVTQPYQFIGGTGNTRFVVRMVVPYVTACTMLDPCGAPPMGDTN